MDLDLKKSLDMSGGEMDPYTMKVCILIKINLNIIYIFFKNFTFQNFNILIL